MTNLPTRSNSDTPEELGRYSKAKGYSLPFFNVGFGLWKIFDPEGKVFTTVAFTEQDMKDGVIDKVVEALNKGRSIYDAVQA